MSIENNEAIYRMLQDIHTVQLDSAKALGRIEQSIETINEDAKEVKALVDKHERVYMAGKITAVPILFTFHLAVKGILSKLGWH